MSWILILNEFKFIGNSANYSLKVKQSLFFAKWSYIFSSYFKSFSGNPVWKCFLSYVPSCLGHVTNLIGLSFFSFLFEPMGEKRRQMRGQWAWILRNSNEESLSCFLIPLRTLINHSFAGYDSTPFEEALEEPLRVSKLSVKIRPSTFLEQDCFLSICFEHF